MPSPPSPPNLPHKLMSCHFVIIEQKDKICHCSLSGLAKSSTSSNPIHSSPSPPSSYTSFFFPSLLISVHIQVIYDFPFLPTHSERSDINHASVYSPAGYRLRFMGQICLLSTFTAHAPSSLAQITGN